MAHQINPLTPLVTEEFKEVNKENYKDYFDKSQEEVSRLRSENRELILSNEKLVTNLAKKKLKLETERTNSVTFRQLIQELNTKVQLLEGAAPPPLLSPTIPPLQNPILNTAINEEFIEKLVIEKTGLENLVYEQKREIEHLNSELMSCKKELTQQTESRHQEYALNREVTQLRTDLALKEQQLAECQSNFLKLEAECKLGKQLFQEALSSLSAEKEQLLQLLDKERGVNGKLGLEIEQLNNLIDTQRTNLMEQVEQLDTSRAIEVKLQTQINKLQNKSLQLKGNENTLRTKINEQNKQMTASTQDTERTLSLIETKDKQISELQTQLTKQQEKEQTYQTQMEKQIKELNEDFEELKSDNVDLENLVKSDAKNEKFLAVEDEKHVLEEQIDLLRGEIDSLTERKQENKQKIEDLEGSFENLTNQSKDLEIQLGESKSDYQKLQIQREQSQQLIDDLKTELETVKNELRCERENSEMWKQLISKLNSDIEKLAQNDSQQRIADLERQLAETEGARGETEQKLGDMATEIANRDTRIHTLEQDIGILHNKTQVAHSTSTPIMPTDTSKTKEDKKQSKVSKDQTKQSSGATPGATPSDLTPQIIPVANKSGKSPFKVPYRSGKNVEVVKLKSLPNPSEYQSKQVMCPVNERYELGVLIGIFDVPGKVGFKSIVQRYVGIKLYNPVGSSNGEFRTKRYFECEPNCGIFVPLEDVLIPVI